MLFVRLLTIILLIIAIILVCVLLWKANHNHIETFAYHPNLILDLNSMISCSVDEDFDISDLKQTEIIFNPRYSSNKVVFIMDGTLTPYQQLTHFSYKDKSIECVHNKTFLCNTKLNKINLLESPIRMIGSGIFHTNLNRNDDSEFYISNQSKFPDKKITIVLYDEVIKQIVDAATKSTNKSSTHWNAFYDTVNTYNDDDANKEKIVKKDGTINEDQLYAFLNDSKIMASNKAEVFKIFIYMCLGVDNTSFKMFKYDDENKPDNVDDAEWTTDDIKKTFRVVYYKDVLYTTDLARWRCNYITEDNAKDADAIVKSSCILHDLDSSVKNDDGSNKKKYMSVIDIFILYILQQMILNNLREDKFTEPSQFVKLHYSGIMQNIINNKTELQSLVTDFLDKMTTGSELEKHYAAILQSTRDDFSHTCDKKCDIKLEQGLRPSCPKFTPKPVFNCETFTNYSREGFQSNSNSETTSVNSETTSANNCGRTCLKVKGKKVCIYCPDMP